MRRSFLTLATFALVLMPIRAYAAAATINVFPVPAVSGQQISVVGYGFCVSAGCSNVTVTIEAQVVASNVKVNADGGFTTSFAIGVVPGDHDVVATQHTANGDQSATAHLIVLPNDNRNTPPPPTGKQGGSTGGATNGPTALRTDGQLDSTAAAGEAGGRTNNGTGGGAAWWIAAIVMALLAALLTGGLIWRTRRAATNPTSQD